MVQPAESLVRQDATRSYGTHPAVRCSLSESEMPAVFVVVANILREQSLQMAFIHHNVIQHCFFGPQAFLANDSLNKGFELYLWISFRTMPCLLQAKEFRPFHHL